VPEGASRFREHAPDGAQVPVAQELHARQTRQRVAGDRRAVGQDVGNRAAGGPEPLGVAQARVHELRREHAGNQTAVELNAHPPPRCGLGELGNTETDRRVLAGSHPGIGPVRMRLGETQPDRALEPVPVDDVEESSSTVPGPLTVQLRYARRPRIPSVRPCHSSSLAEPRAVAPAFTSTATRSWRRGSARSARASGRSRRPARASRPERLFYVLHEPPVQRRLAAQQANLIDACFLQRLRAARKIVGGMSPDGSPEACSPAKQNPQRR